MSTKTDRFPIMTEKVKYIGLGPYKDKLKPDQILTIKEMIPYAWHGNFTFEEVEGEYHTIFFEDVKDT
tara:strand:+ start:267 stop:470 length:204 start_codon:yes stop_codon:yes gene_type:complete